ncbi:Putative phenylalanine aminotransferase [Xylophilus ampelinus]|nr:aminotransferase class I/II-fold pyridoxal phosphate-dependent enzyme [Variovorax sp.]VTY33574.1 Putative phenylalanine aminotransferase [Xylophilus ampelinus]
MTEMTVHGGPDAQGVPLHDFSTNANACGPCPPALEALRAADPSRYPDPNHTELRERLAAFHGVARERIVAAASASEFIVRITAAAAADGGGTAVVPVPAYGDYARAARAHGLALHLATATAPGAPAARLAWGCEPSTPLGQDDPHLAARVDAWPADRPFVLDRAYAPLRLDGPPGGSLGPDRLSRVWQLWSPNKALGLTGVRGAYAIAPCDVPPAFLARLQGLAPSWPLGAHAVAMLTAWVEAPAQDWLSASLAVLERWKRRQQRLCTGLGCEVRPSVANFFCMRWPAGLPLPPVLDSLRAQGIKLRDCASFGLSGHVRLGVLAPESQDALAAAWNA